MHNTNSNLLNLYIHFPFCESKCKYCAFYSGNFSDSIIDAYIKALPQEFLLRELPTSPPLKTLYFGGGTPGLIGPSRLKKLCKNFKNIGIDLASAQEWTVELNPSRTTEPLLECLKEIGVNRISIGVQSFNDDTLALIGRGHSSIQAISALELAQSFGFDDVGFDLIAGLPNVTDTQWLDTLKTGLSLNPKHISVYALGIEPKTLLAKELSSGKYSLPSTDETMDTLLLTEDHLATHDFNRYEISNYALPGFECKHNLACWQGEDYIGLGTAASSRNKLNRRKNLPDIKAYIEAIQNELPPQTEEDFSVTEIEDLTERFVYALRLNKGVNPNLFAKHNPAIANKAILWEATLFKYSKLGITQALGPNTWALTPRGREVADALFSELM